MFDIQFCTMYTILFALLRVGKDTKESMNTTNTSFAKC